MAIEIPIPRVEAFKAQISRTETAKPANDAISQDETQRANRPAEPSSGLSRDDVANGVAAMRACRGVLEGLRVPVRGTVISTMAAELLACWPQSSRGEILRVLIKQTNAALATISPDETPPDAAA